MMTCVYSRSSGRSSSRSSSCAEPRRPPSGFLISCARLRISSRLATACVRLRSSRSMRSCWSIERSSRTSRARPCSAGVARQLRCSGGRPGRSRSIAWSQNPQFFAIAWRSFASNCRACDEEIREALAGELPRAGLEQVLGRRVDVEDAELRVEHDDRRAEQIETGEGRSVHPPLRPGCAARRRRGAYRSAASSRLSAETLRSCRSTAS